MKVGTKITYNVGGKFRGANSDRVVADDIVDMIEKHQPIVITLQEVWDRKAALAAVVQRTGYKPVIPPGPAGHSAVLLHPHCIIDKSGEPLLLSARTYVGKLVAGARDDGWHRKNEMIYVRYRYNGRKYIDGVVHLVPSHNQPLANRLSKLQVGVLTAWLWTRKRIASLSGDFNETPDFAKDTLGPLEKIGNMVTDRERGTFGDRRAIDYWVFLRRQTRKHAFRYVPEALEGYHSDHKPLLVTIHRRN